MLGAVLLPSAALAHPHIFIDAKATITFNDAGQVVGIHNSWTFDEAYSAWAVQGLDTNADGVVTREELQPLADDNMQGLSDYEYYTFAGEGPENLKFAYGSNPTMDYADGRQTLNFDVALDTPYAIRDHLELAINDPEYYVGITFANADAITLVNTPATCSVTLEDPEPMSDALYRQLTDLGPDVTSLPTELAQQMRGAQGAIVINCAGGSATGRPAAAVAAAEPSTALDAVTQMAEVTPTLVTTGDLPLGGPPPEPGLILPKTGILGWVSKVQADFYLDLVKSLDALKQDWTAFWVLGGLSFLYGIFHAAGPGHGKVVIGSYVLANEAQVRRGVWLSFLSAMLQSLVAIAFVLVAALLLGMTSMAMNDAARWIGVLSYAIIVLLGFWLIVRKVFRLGHHHDHAKPATSMQSLARLHLGQPAHALAAGGPSLTNFAVATGPDAYGRHPGHPHYGHNHGDDDHDHAHVVMPGQTGGGWREQLGVVLAVGLRPCSGALIVLAFALSQGLLAAGIVAVLLMGLGTAITTGSLAALAAGAKGLARKLAGADNPVTTAILWWVELLAAVAVLGFGAVLLLASL
jgi:nickel/cobalt transporter (NicO) family protein